MYKVCYWDDAEKVQKERDATPDEVAEIEARKSAPPPVPQSVTRRQAKQALALNLDANGATLLSKVQPAIDAIADQTEKALLQIEWDDSQVFLRNRASLIAIGTAIGLDAAGIDALFIQAAAL